MEWLPILFASLLAGIPNLWRGYEELQRQSSRLPLLRPYLSRGYLLCLAIHLLFPAISFLLLVVLASSLVTPLINLQPSLSLTLLLYAIGFGIAFEEIVRGRFLELPTLGAIDVGKYYRNLLEYSYLQIRREEARRTASFFYDLVQELQQLDTRKLKERLQSYLKPYFREARASDRALNSAEKISRAIAFRQPQKIAEEIADLLLEVERRDLPDVLYRLECDRTLNKYFPSWQPKPPRD